MNNEAHRELHLSFRDSTLAEFDRRIEEAGQRGDSAALIDAFVEKMKAAEKLLKVDIRKVTLTEDTEEEL